MVDEVVSLGLSCVDVVCEEAVVVVGEGAGSCDEIVATSISAVVVGEGSATVVCSCDEITSVIAVGEGDVICVDVDAVASSGVESTVCMR